MPDSFDGSVAPADALTDVVTMDGLGILGTVGFFIAAAVLIALVVGAVVRDRRLTAREAAAEAQPEGFERKAIPSPPPPADRSPS